MGRRIDADSLICSLGYCKCNGHRMHSKVSSDWLPSYINATPPVLETFKLAGNFPDSPRTQFTLTSTRSQTEDPLAPSHQKPKPNLEGRPKLSLEDVNGSEGPTRLSKQFQALSYGRTTEREYRRALGRNLVLGSCAGGISRLNTVQGTSESTGNHIL